MMLYKKLILIILLAAFSTIPLYTVNEKAGTSGFTFLKIQISPRAAALGNAYTGLAFGAGAVYYNPAGLVQMDNPQLEVNYMNYFQGINCGSFAFAYPRNDKETYALFGQFLTASEDRTLADPFGELIETGEKYSMSDLIIGISVSRYIINVLHLGVNIKYIQESLDENVGSALAFDIGFLHQTTNKNLKVGLVVKNLGQQIQYYTENEYKEKLPVIVTAGFGYHPHEKLYAVLDLSKPVNNDMFGNFGIEYNPADLLAIRIGYKTNAGDWKTGGDYEVFSGLTAGLGFKWYKYQVDYAIASFGDLGLVNQIGIKYNF